MARFRPSLLSVLIAPSLLFAFAPLAQSQAPDAESIVQACGDLPTQSAMNACAAKAAAKADADLNTTYQQLLTRLKGNATATAGIVAAERAWLAFRDAELAAIWPVPHGETANLLYGSAHPFCYSIELATMTVERTKTLKELMRVEEGDICAPGLALTNNREAAGTCSASVLKPARQPHS